MDYVQYIDKTSAYYRSQGYDKIYNWAQNDSAPFTPLRKPLSASRVTLISTAGFTLAPEEGLSEEELWALRVGGSNMGSYDLEVWPVPSDIAEERIVYLVANHDRAQSEMADPNAYFPVTRLRELHTEGLLGSLAANYFRLKENYSQRKTLEVDAPELLRRCREDGVDVALLSPV
ncbi:MAG: hypothetical protein O7E56_01250 [SAR324 cluster bacterium]|nr:hypothetical protein [SAR324 cluster bacterium]MCZ6558725.1 hypothetical protein [SAR324 cluster bacterium]MCZ6626830.1 hypothetical protein [SAR324 cluster bacterium]MCZ6728642.1 hypothetical protein [SAR324 cluster bacterium]MCZ6843421.1 hypothetical protein [SAR324 cluster bacterium]